MEYYQFVQFSFLICSERSGSNLVTRLLDGHSKICGPSPTHLFRILLEHRSLYGNLSDSLAWQTLLQDTVSLTETRLGPWKSSVSADGLLRDVEPGDVGALLRYVYEREAQASGKNLVFVKENQIYRQFAFIENNFPGSQFVFLVRDPRDMALSWKLAPNIRGGVIRAAETWSADQKAGLALFNALSSSRRIVGIRYEDLIAQPIQTLEEVCRTLGIDFEDGMTDLDSKRGNQSVADSTQEWGNLNRPVIHGNSGKYLDSLSTEEIQFVEGTCALEMKIFGYSPTYPERPALVDLREMIQPLELYRKPNFLTQPEAAQKRHVARAMVLEQMLRREPLSPSKDWSTS